MTSSAVIATFCSAYFEEKCECGDTTSDPTGVASARSGAAVTCPALAEGRSLIAFTPLPSCRHGSENDACRSASQSAFGNQQPDAALADQRRCPVVGNTTYAGINSRLDT